MRGAAREEGDAVEAGLEEELRLRQRVLLRQIERARGVDRAALPQPWSDRRVERVARGPRTRVAAAAATAAPIGLVRSRVRRRGEH